MSHVVVGTAGHIDHGKSSLVLALTGTDPDRLPEERKRKITIDLGYAFLSDDVAVIDVPGHEKFIRNMVAGASTVDYAVLVVAADDGVMPQTTEHLQILRLLGVRSGCSVITKIDMAEPDWIDLVEEQIDDATRGTFLQDRPVCRVDSISRKGIDEFRAFLLKELADMPPRPDHGIFRLPVDRVFTIKGHGTIVTGTVLSGSVQKDSRLSILPGDGAVRVKHVESHGKESDFVSPGQRTALNLIGDVDALRRGSTLTEPRSLADSSRVRVAIERLPGCPPFKDRQRIRFLIGTDEVLGRAQIISQNDSKCFANLLLEARVVAAWGDRFILRRYSPMETLGGGRVLEPCVPRLKSSQVAAEAAYSAALDSEFLDQAVDAFLSVRATQGISIQECAQRFGVPVSALREHLGGTVIEIQEQLIPRAAFEEWSEVLLTAIEHYHASRPDAQGVSLAELKSASLSDVAEPILQAAVEKLIEREKLARRSGLLFVADRKVRLSESQQKLVDSISEKLKAGGFSPPSAAVLAEELHAPKSEVEKALVIMERIGLTARLDLDLFFDKSCFDSAVLALRSSLAGSAGMTVADISKLLSSSRKYVVPFLEFLDREGITRRDGNLRLPGTKLVN